MVREDQSLARTQGMGQPLALFEVEHDAGVIVEHGMVAVERTGVLGQGVEWTAQR